MEIFRVRGGNTLKGEVKLSGAKNAALSILFGSLLSDDKVILRNVPTKMEDIKVAIKVIRHLGARVNIKGSVVTIDPSGISKTRAHPVYSSKIRPSLLLLSVLLARFGKVDIPTPGGCEIGVRKFDLHIDGLKALGADIIVDSEGIRGTLHGRFRGQKVEFYLPSSTGTVNLIMAGSLAKGRTIIRNANAKPETQDFIEFMKSMGARIKYSNRYVEIDGVRKLRGTDYTIMKGNDEAITYMIAAGMTGGEVKIADYTLSSLKFEVQCLRDAGIEIFEWDGSVYVSGKMGLRPFDLFTAPYPGVNSDLQPLFAALALMAPGESSITDQVFTERFGYVSELKQFGADIENYGNSAIVRGGKPLKSACVTATDLRGGTAMLLASLVARGETIIRNVYQIDRGYERIEKKLGRLGASIERVRDSG